MRVGIVMGTRPEIIKNYSIVKALRDRSVPVEVIHTNQHSDHAMHGAFFDALGYAADHVLAGEYRLGRAIDWVSGILRTQAIDVVIVNGDTAAALVGTLAALYSDVEIAHVEAGLRSNDPFMYEERNRLMVDSAAHHLLTYTDRESDLLRRTPALRGRIVTVGNTTIDVMEDFADRIVVPEMTDYGFATLHRKELTDDPERLTTVLAAISEASRDLERIVLPLHPRTADVIRRHGITIPTSDHLVVIDPVPVFESLAYIRGASVVITDSGCVQEEAYLYRVPCVTVRKNTERHATVEVGANIVTGFERSAIVDGVRRQLAARATMAFPPIYGTPGAGERIVSAICDGRPSVSGR
ncbi:MAG: UDP-N-acetylglucosamine 2-epimerase (non-hydrolyzing) [Actinomycetota bacterium]